MGDSGVSISETSDGELGSSWDVADLLGCCCCRDLLLAVMLWALLRCALDLPCFCFGSGGGGGGGSSSSSS